MSIARKCPYKNENCKYEIFAGEPIFKKCKFCSRNSGNKGKQIEGVTMFEKEAEEKGNEKIKGNYELACVARKIYIDGFKDGAEVGYNKAKEEDKALIEKMKSCSNCIHYSSTFGLCHYSMGDEDYDCRGRKWEIKEK